MRLETSPIDGGGLRYTTEPEGRYLADVTAGKVSRLVCDARHMCWPDWSRDEVRELSVFLSEIAERMEAKDAR